MSLRKAVDCVRKYNSFLITSHTNLEGDALGSELAFYLLLKKLGKGAVIINEDDAPREYDFLPEKSNIKKFKENLKGRVSFDCFAALDCSDLSRSGEVYRINTGKKPVLNIDHHISNSRFGDINWVDPGASSCSEMIYRLYKKLGIPLDKEAALLLYAGIITDTGSFRYSNTTAFTHRAAAQMLRFNIDPAQVYKNIYENMAFQDVKFLAKILPGMKLSAGGKIAWFQLKRGILKHKKFSFDLSETLLNFTRAVKGVEVCVLFKENLGAKGEVRVNFRSRGGLDVNKIAQSLGGGGHKTASAATIKGDIGQIRRRVLDKIRDSLKDT